MTEGASTSSATVMSALIRRRGGWYISNSSFGHPSVETDGKEIASGFRLQTGVNARNDRVVSEGFHLSFGLWNSFRSS